MLSAQKNGDNKDIKKKESQSIRRGIRKLRKRIKEHEEYINSPEIKVPDFTERDKRYQEGLVKHWEKEIENFKRDIDRGKNELIIRGDFNEEIDK